MCFYKYQETGEWLLQIKCLSTRTFSKVCALVITETQCDSLSSKGIWFVVQCYHTLAGRFRTLSTQDLVIKDAEGRAMLWEGSTARAVCCRSQATWKTLMIIWKMLYFKQQNILFFILSVRHLTRIYQTKVYLHQIIQCWSLELNKRINILTFYKTMSLLFTHT